MVIKTKFDIGDSVFFMEHNKIYNCSIKEIEFHKQARSTTTLNYFNDGSVGSKLDRETFATKEELLASL